MKIKLDKLVKKCNDEKFLKKTEPNVYHMKMDKWMIKRVLNALGIAYD